MSFSPFHLPHLISHSHTPPPHFLLCHSSPLTLLYDLLPLTLLRRLSSLHSFAALCPPLPPHIHPCPSPFILLWCIFLLRLTFLCLPSSSSFIPHSLPSNATSRSSLLLCHCLPQILPHTPPPMYQIEYVLNWFAKIEF